MSRWLAAVLLLGLAGTARAGDGTVLRIDGADVYVDLGSDAGVSPGSVLILRHVVVVTHPVTHQRLRDTFELGRLEVTRAGRKMCVAHAPADLVPRVAVGDEIDLASAPRAVSDPWVAPAAAAPAPTPAGGGGRTAQVAALEAAGAAWQQTLGKPPTERIAIWRAYLDGHPGSPVAATVRVEISQLAAQARADELRASSQARAGAAGVEEARERRRLRRMAADASFVGPLVTERPSHAYQGTPVELVFQIIGDAPIASAWLHYRRAGEPTYRRTELRRDGAWLRGRVPADAVQPPGVDWFVDTLAPGEQLPVAAFGSAAEPTRFAVDSGVSEPPPDRTGRSRVSLSVDYVDFDGGLQGGYDQYVQAEADFAYRFYAPVESVRIGFGTLGGEGGPKNVIDEDPTGQCRDRNGDVPCRHVNYTYAYVEAERRLTPMISAALRGIAGGAYRNAPAGARDYFDSLGLRGRLRIGQESESNLLLGVGFSQHFGTLIEAGFNFLAVPGVPIMLGAQVTDQPVIADFGVRLIADIGVRRWSWVYPSLRISYQARDIDHAGVSGGLGLVFDW